MTVERSRTTAWQRGWGGNAAERPGENLVAIDGAGEQCDRCGYDEERDFYVFVERDVIARVVPADGSLSLVGLDESFIVLID